ncbi:uncharacterized protein I206_103585 [Kwoniella pini CBS 10737]|uniref:Protein CPL1-like domain-containing protein n=1 Tax=Kwoniella pini CBS 10737 TaxID=1296096 RepID=A0A1B9I9B5_9TREE|nr:uncharacterized protein I206_01411 [Kwoniella pini CBS 10737]OCF52126.1 hypothetical protein I206_01411 [Kwoniella pini CBS 10737]
MLSAIIAYFIITLVISATKADEVFIGCYSYPGVLEGQTMEKMPSADISCFNHCIASDWPYTLDRVVPRNDGGLDRYCLCSVEAPSVEFMVGNADLCSANDPSVVTVSANVPRWRWTDDLDRTCWGVDGGSPSLYHPVNNALECINICSRYALVVYKDNNSPPGCWCEGFRWWEETIPVTCGFNVAFTYEFKFWETQPSSVAKRQAREKRLSKPENSRSYCLNGMKACNILNGEGLSYECIDVSTELESCGGCLHGEFGKYLNKTSQSVTGIDCTSLPGVTLSGVTCSDGVCVSSSCEEGYALHNGACVATLN